jgi:hypothetical protein
VLDEAAQSINGLGDVVWSNVTDLSRHSYLSRLDGTLWRVMACASTLRVTPPPGATELEIHEPMRGGESRWRAVSDEATSVSLQGGRMPLRPGNGGSAILLERVQVRDPAPEGRHWTSPKLLVRRALTEIRDRLSGIQDRGEKWTWAQSRSQ